ncbi:hypothetical protein ACHWQZ_G001644 [Mnemiopsis leidyi]
MNLTRLCTYSTRSCLLSTRYLSTSSEYKVKGTAEFFDKQKVLNRPMSPHLTIYKPQLTSILSISHRVSGVGWGVLIYGGTLLTLMPGGFSHYVQLAEQVAPGAGIMIALKATLLLPLTYHTLNGFRHLAWDTGKGFKIAEVYKSGWSTVAVSVLISLLIAIAL